MNTLRILCAGAMALILLARPLFAADPNQPPPAKPPGIETVSPPLANPPPANAPPAAATAPLANAINPASEAEIAQQLFFDIRGLQFNLAPLDPRTGARSPQFTPSDLEAMRVQLRSLEDLWTRLSGFRRTIDNPYNPLYNGLAPKFTDPNAFLNWYFSTNPDNTPEDELLYYKAQLVANGYNPNAPTSTPYQPPPPGTVDDQASTVGPNQLEPVTVDSPPAPAVSGNQTAATPPAVTGEPPPVPTVSGVSSETPGLLSFLNSKVPPKAEAGILAGVTALAGCLMERAFREGDPDSQQITLAQCAALTGVSAAVGAGVAAAVLALPAAVLAAFGPPAAAMLVAYGVLNGVSSMAELADEFGKLKEAGNYEPENNVFRDRMNQLMKSCDYAAALRLAQYLVQTHPDQYWLRPILPTLTKRALMQAQINTLLQQANALPNQDDPQRAQLIQQAQAVQQQLAAATGGGPGACLPKAPPSAALKTASAAPPKATASTNSGSSTPAPTQAANTGACANPNQTKKLLCWYDNGASAPIGANNRCPTVCTTNWIPGASPSTGQTLAIIYSGSCPQGSGVSDMDDVSEGCADSSSGSASAAPAAPSAPSSPGQACVPKSPYLPWGKPGSATITVSPGQSCGVAWKDTPGGRGGITVLDGVTTISAPQHGSYKVRSNGDQHVIIYTAAPKYTGDDPFILSLKEHNGGQTATMTVNVSVTVK